MDGCCQLVGLRCEALAKHPVREVSETVGAVSDCVGDQSTSVGGSWRLSESVGTVGGCRRLSYCCRSCRWLSVAVGLSLTWSPHGACRNTAVGLSVLCRIIAVRQCRTHPRTHLPVTVGLSEWCRKSLSDCRTRAQAEQGRKGAHPRELTVHAGPRIQ
jgi:hypothetical protein